MAEEQVLDTPQVDAPAVEEPRSVDLQEEGSIVDDVIFGGAEGAVTEAFDREEQDIANPEEPYEEPSVEVASENDEVRYQYWQSQADKLKNGQLKINKKKMLNKFFFFMIFLCLNFSLYKNLKIYF